MTDPIPVDASLLRALATHIRETNPALDSEDLVARVGTTIWALFSLPVISEDRVRRASTLLKTVYG